MIVTLERHRQVVWVTWLIAALLFLQTGSPLLYGTVVPASAGLLVLLEPGLLPHVDRRVDVRDLGAVLVLYVGVVTSLVVSMRVFTQDQVAGLFAFLALAMILGVVGPIVYTVWMRHRPLADLGLRVDNWRRAVALGVVLGTVQFALTLYGYDLPQPVDWVPLAFLALMVGLFEAVFFRGFVQARLSAGFGPIAGVTGAAALYGLYHIGYGMGPTEMVFTFGLGIVYGIAYACVNNILVLWPLLVPMGSFYNNLQNGDIDMPWAAILGFLDILAVMATAIWLARRREHRAARQPAPGPRVPEAAASR
jgi:membrane protease YdiL (CAAX protease family)